MKEHNSFLLYKDNRELLEDLTDEEKGVLFQALYDFACDGVESDFKDRAVKVAYRTMRNSIERDDNKYQERCERNTDYALGRYAKELGISLDVFKLSKEKGITTELLKGLGITGRELEAFIYSYEPDNANECVGMPKHTDSDSDSDSDIGRDTVIGRDTDTGRDTVIGRDTDTGRGVAEGEPISAASKMQGLMDYLEMRKKEDECYIREKQMNESSEEMPY